MQNKSFINRYNFFAALLFCLIFLLIGTAQAENTIIDDSGVGTSFTGTWSPSSAVDPYATNSLWSRSGATYTWHANLPNIGMYEVYMWWTQYPSRANNVPVLITHKDGSQSVIINQQINGGRWNLLGTYAFEPISEATVMLTAAQDAPTSYCADAVKFVRIGDIPNNTFIIDNNTSTSTSFTGTWSASGAADPYGTNSLWSRSGATYTWHMDLPSDDIYEVYMWWTQYPSRADNAPITITSTQGPQIVNINQQINGGQWNLLGTYSFNAASGATVKLTAVQGEPTSYCADAVKLVRIDDVSNTPPVASITAIDPNPAIIGNNITLSGSGTDIDGTIINYKWHSSLDGDLGSANILTLDTLSKGTHIITFTVQDDDLAWSAAVSQELTITQPEVILDNGNSGTSFTGSWAASGAANPYGTTSLWSRDGATYTWQTNLPISGKYQVYMHWTQYYSRSTNVPVTIFYSDDSETVTVNQQINGGIWNLLGTYYFDAVTGGTVKITASGTAPLTYCADAVKFVYNTDNIPPIASINYIAPSPVQSGATVTLSGKGTDTDGEIVNYRWFSNLDGIVGNTYMIETNALSAGQHNISFSVQDNEGTWSQTVSQNITVTNANIEHIYYCVGYAETNTEYPLSQMLISLGATNSGPYWTYRNTSQNKTYYIHIIKDIESMKQALMTNGAHIIYTGHSSYGLGSIFPTEQEHNNGIIENVKAIDDDRIFNYSAKWIAVGLNYIRTLQAYPNFWPIFKDGSSGIMPFTFNDPKGNPPYNYYLTYQIPGDPIHYKIETVRNSGIEHFFNSDTSAWYSKNGYLPDASNPNHKEYFVTNDKPWIPSVEIVGNWVQSQSIPGYYNENYHYSAAGNGENQFHWMFSIPENGNYRIFSWWPANNNNTATAPYTIYHSLGSSTILVNQQEHGNKWNEIGEYYFEAGNYSVFLSNNVNSGRVIADGLRISHTDNPEEIIHADFRGSPLYGTAPLSIRLRIQTPSNYTGLHWNFGDGTENSSRDDITHIYTEPGIYPVTLTITNSLGSDTKTQEDYVYVGEGLTQTRAEFSCSPQISTVPANVYFSDRSSGNIVSWFWDFGDGTTSTQERPVHMYTDAGNYSISLTVTDSANNVSTETKADFVRVNIYEKNLDNINYPLTHYSSKTILFRNEPEIKETELKYSRMCYIACNSGNYYLDTFHRGVTFYTLGTPTDTMAVHYLQAYLENKSDYEIWQILQSHYPVFDYYNFNKKPSEQ